ncbi:MAG: hypothetical protein HUJ16_07990 [Kangiella sp.]|nr:hypothetical protein [Kangiella sp.]
MKIIIPFLTLLLIGLNSNAEESCEKNISKEDAKEIAIHFLMAQGWADKYIKEPESMIENRCQWIVSFKHINWETIKPGEGWIAVDQTSGHAKWISLR